MGLGGGGGYLPSPVRLLPPEREDPLPRTEHHQLVCDHLPMGEGVSFPREGRPSRHQSFGSRQTFGSPSSACRRMTFGTLQLGMSDESKSPACGEGGIGNEQRRREGRGLSPTVRLLTFMSVTALMSPPGDHVTSLPTVFRHDTDCE